MEQALIKDRKYCGRYVAIKDFDDNTVIGDGREPREAYEKAIKKGYKDPVILFVPLKDDVLIDFMPNLYVPLLGVKSFLSNLALTIDYPNLTFSLSTSETS